MTVLADMRQRVATASPSATLRLVPIVALVTDLVLV